MFQTQTFKKKKKSKSNRKMLKTLSSPQSFGVMAYLHERKHKENLKILKSVIEVNIFKNINSFIKLYF